MNFFLFFKQWAKSRVISVCLLVVFYAFSELLYWLFEVQHHAVFHYLRHLFILLAGIGFMLDCWLCYRRFSVFQQWLCNPTDSSPSLTVLNPTEQLLYQYSHSLALQHEHLQIQTSQRASEQLDFYTLWVHQIKTPITALSLLIDQLSSTQEASSFKQELFKIQQYTESVLHYLRMETFHQDLVLQRISLDTLVRQTIKKYAPFFISKNIRLILEDCHLDVTTDPKWLTIVLEQLLSNALKYTSEGSIRVAIVGQTLLIQDTGIGIRPEDIHRVFERGFTGFNGRINQQSSGLGLYLCQQITQKLGLQLQIDSTVGEGTTVRLTFEEQPITFE